MLNEGREKTKETCCSDDILMKPFALGWTREVVNRVISKNRNLNCDIYYFSPTGKKIRSLTEIKSNLTDGLTPECFSFKKQPLGINECFETVRDARVKRKGNETLGCSNSQKNVTNTRTGMNTEQSGDASKSKRRKVLNSSMGKKNNNNDISEKESTKSEMIFLTDKYDKIKERTEKAKRNTKSSSSDINFSSLRKINMENEPMRSQRIIKPSLKILRGSKQPKITANKQLNNKAIKKRVRASNKSKLNPGKTKKKEAKSKGKVTSSPKTIKKTSGKNTGKVTQEVTNTDTKCEEGGHVISTAKDLRSIVKKNIGKYREMREKQKLAIKSQIKVNKERKIVVGSTKRTRSEPVSKNRKFYLKPLENGWRRELVYRKNCARAGQQADVYYFHPNGKKLRSCREVSENLTQGLTIEYFTFRKEAIGCGEPYEIIREARSHGK